MTCLRRHNSKAKIQKTAVLMAQQLNNINTEIVCINSMYQCINRNILCINAIIPSIRCINAIIPNILCINAIIPNLFFVLIQKGALIMY